MTGTPTGTAPTGAASTATISAAAISHNVGVLRDRVGTAELCAVVKADGYGHGAVRVARAALGAGVERLAVAQVDEAAALRAAGIDAPVVVLSEPPVEPAVLDRALAGGLQLAVYRAEFLDALAARAAACGVPAVPVHLKVDTGMRRVGCSPDDAVDLARRIAADPHLHLVGTMTHLAVADEPDNDTTGAQLADFDAVLGALVAAGIDPGTRHAANSAAAIAHPDARYDLVRVGIALYGIPPAPALDGMVDLRPAMRWVSTVRHHKRVPSGAAVSYGHRHTVENDTVLATVPVGYADGYRRRLGLAGGEVLIGGRRCPVVGVVTMDQFVVDVGHLEKVAVGDEVVLIGSQGDETITAAEIADHLDTIGYEITCGIGPRVTRVDG